MPVVGVSTTFLVLPNFPLCFYNLLETRKMLFYLIRGNDFRVAPWLSRRHEQDQATHVSFFMSIDSSMTFLPFLMKESSPLQHLKPRIQNRLGLLVI